MDNEKKPVRLKPTEKSTRKSKPKLIRRASQSCTGSSNVDQFSLERSNSASPVRIQPQSDAIHAFAYQQLLVNARTGPNFGPIWPPPEPQINSFFNPFLRMGARVPDFAQINQPLISLTMLDYPRHQTQEELASRAFFYSMNSVYGNRQHRQRESEPDASTGGESSSALPRNYNLEVSEGPMFFPYLQTVSTAAVELVTSMTENALNAGPHGRATREGTNNLPNDAAANQTDVARRRPSVVFDNRSPLLIHQHPPLDFDAMHVPGTPRRILHDDFSSALLIPSIFDLNLTLYDVEHTPTEQTAPGMHEESVDLVSVYSEEAPWLETDNLAFLLDDPMLSVNGVGRAFEGDRPSQAMVPNINIEYVEVPQPISYLTSSLPAEVSDMQPIYDAAIPFILRVASSHLDSFEAGARYRGGGPPHHHRLNVTMATADPPQLNMPVLVEQPIVMRSSSGTAYDVVDTNWRPQTPTPTQQQMDEVSALSNSSADHTANNINNKVVDT